MINKNNVFFELFLLKNTEMSTSYVEKLKERSGKNDRFTK